jgi:hypothetical protein
VRKCSRCGRALHAQEPGRITLAVTDGVPPANVAWRCDYPWPYVILCKHCSQAVAQVVAESPRHRAGGGPPIEAEEWKAKQEAARRY